jgi:proteasome regulatory subunit
MADRIQKERAKNLWDVFLRKVDPLARGAHLTVDPALSFDQIGGLANAKEEILTYACAAENPEIYGKWGTYPPSGILLIGRQGVGKSLLAKALATRTETSFLRVDVPRLVLDVVHSGGKVGELVDAWTNVLEEMPPLTVFFDELEFSQAQEIGSRRPDLPIGPIGKSGRCEPISCACENSSSSKNTVSGGISSSTSDHDSTSPPTLPPL